MSVVLLGAICLGLGGCQFDGASLAEDGTEQMGYFGKPTSDQEGLSSNVKKALRNGSLTSMLIIDVSTISEGTVRLSGHVDSFGARSDAERIASKVDGVEFVINSLSIR